MQAHSRSGVVTDIAAFKDSHCEGSPKVDATALRAARAWSGSIEAMGEGSRRLKLQAGTFSAMLS